MSGEEFGANRDSLGVQRRLGVPNNKHSVDQTVKLADTFPVRTLQRRSSDSLLSYPYVEFFSDCRETNRSHKKLNFAISYYTIIEARFLPIY